MISVRDGSGRESGFGRDGQERETRWGSEQSCKLRNYEGEIMDINMEK
jgi:hypothetical protein